MKAVENFGSKYRIKKLQNDLKKNYAHMNNTPTFALSNSGNIAMYGVNGHIIPSDILKVLSENSEALELISLYNTEEATGDLKELAKDLEAHKRW